MVARSAVRWFSFKDDLNVALECDDPRLVSRSILSALKATPVKGEGRPFEGEAALAVPAATKSAKSENDKL